MPTGQQIINGALTTLGILEQGGTPSVSDSNDALDELNSMWEAFGIDEGLVYAIVPYSGTVVANVGVYTIGVDATYNTYRPWRIYEAFFVVGGARNRLEIVEALRYYAHRDLGAVAKCPDELYPDYNIDTNGYATLRLFPVPSVGGALEIEEAAAFSEWTLTTVYQLPRGFQELVVHSLAWHLIPRYGSMIDQQLVQHVNELATKAEARIREMNAKNRQLPPEAAGLTPPAQPTGAQQ